MSISPEVNIPDIDDLQAPNDTSTYRYDIKTGRITKERISGVESVKQFIYFQLQIKRYLFPIYSSDVGQELTTMLSDNTTSMSYKLSEAPRLIEEALIYDDRINGVYDFQMEHKDDEVFVDFRVDTIYGEIEISEVIGLVRTNDI